MPCRTVQPRSIACTHPGCTRLFTNHSGLNNHLRVHQRPTVNDSDSEVEGYPAIINHEDPDPQDLPQTPELQENNPGPEAVAYLPRNDLATTHPLLNGKRPSQSPKFFFVKLLQGLPCDANGEFLPEGTPPPSWDYPPRDDYTPFENRAAFELADLLYRRNQMSGGDINQLLRIWASHGTEGPPFTDKDDLYRTIDAIELGDAPWESFSLSYDGDLADSDNTPWKREEYTVWMRDPRQIMHNQLGNQDFAKEMDYAPKHVCDEDGKRQYGDFMSGDWAWRQAVSVPLKDFNIQ